MLVNKKCELCDCEYSKVVISPCSDCKYGTLNGNSFYCNKERTIVNDDLYDCPDFESRYYGMDVCDDCEYVINVAVVEAIEGVIGARAIKRTKRADVEDAIGFVLMKKGVI